MYGNIEALKALPKCQEKFPGRFSMVDTLWTCPKLHIDGQNHKNTCFRRAIFHKRPSRRARPSIDGPLGHTGNPFLWIRCIMGQTDTAWTRTMVDFFRCELLYCPFYYIIIKTTIFALHIFIDLGSHLWDFPRPQAWWTDSVRLI